MFSVFYFHVSGENASLHVKCLNGNRWANQQSEYYNKSVVQRKFAWKIKTRLFFKNRFSFTTSAFKFSAPLNHSVSKFVLLENVNAKTKEKMKKSKLLDNFNNMTNLGDVCLPKPFKFIPSWSSRVVERQAKTIN